RSLLPTRRELIAPPGLELKQAWQPPRNRPCLGSSASSPAWIVNEEDTQPGSAANPVVTLGVKDAAGTEQAQVARPHIWRLSVLWTAPPPCRSCRAGVRPLVRACWLLGIPVVGS